LQREQQRQADPVTGAECHAGEAPEILVAVAIVTSVHSSS